MLASVIRTVVPYLVGWVATMLLQLGITMPAEVEAWATEALVVLIGTGYYVAARWLERHGVTLPLLGVTAQPTYTTGAHRDQDGDGVADGLGHFDAEVTAYRAPASADTKTDAAYHGRDTDR